MARMWLRWRMVLEAVETCLRIEKLEIRDKRSFEESDEASLARQRPEDRERKRERARDIPTGIVPSLGRNIPKGRM